jgi:bacterioferritin-associated ferredoxin
VGVDRQFPAADPSPATIGYNLYMQLDDDVCCCFHVPLRKLLNFAKRERPVRASQMSNCLGAGTGCGWCIPFLQRIHAQSMTGQEAPADEHADVVSETSETYSAAREAYLQSKGKNTFESVPE